MLELLAAGWTTDVDFPVFSQDEWTLNELTSSG